MLVERTSGLVKCQSFAAKRKKEVKTAIAVNKERKGYLESNENILNRIPAKSCMVVSSRFVAYYACVLLLK